ncbi:ATP-dependent RNA helicase A-like isoform X2 [Paramacrobiotus metropolitanus]|uniref:ATP-dependent RNA helicase A-like isoform X2 n=1 Tax=Paramacrobiotus metropolitanus TaxID=2943436 RepID=UPI002446583F|nr:ATP-dependent RNA helicase A-like isoform X2 [Paramacrobiotus metropolitanus]
MAMKLATSELLIGVYSQSPYAGGMPSGYGGGAAPQASYGGGSGYGGGGGGYGGGGGSNYGYNQGTGVYFKKPVPIDEKPIFFRTPYWLPNMYYGHYGYPWTEWFDGGPRYVIPIMNRFPHGGGSTQTYGAGYTYNTNGTLTDSYSGGTAYGSTDTSGTTTQDPLNDGFSYYRGIPMYQTYYEKYLLQKSQQSTPAPA